MYLTITWWTTTTFIAQTSYPLLPAPPHPLTPPQPPPLSIIDISFSAITCALRSLYHFLYEQHPFYPFCLHMLEKRRAKGRQRGSGGSGGGVSGGGGVTFLTTSLTHWRHSISHKHQESAASPHTHTHTHAHVHAHAHVPCHNHTSCRAVVGGRGVYR